MIERYCRPEMKAVWSEENRLQTMLSVEIYACEAMADLGQIPREAYEDIKTKARFDIKRVKEIEATVNHDVIAFLTCVGENVGEASKYIHLGMTSSDILDTATSKQLQQSADLLLEKLYKLRDNLAAKAKEHKYTLMMGRTHGIHAEPVTFGLKMALWMTEVDRMIRRLNNARETISVGAISGAVGTFANIDPRVEEHICRRMGLHP
ncbi:MAG: adenylosuccinate lyase, partial [Firmicutes bacterium]|nr:adenylosuccinate lyase [Bacillota bacterium]